MRHFLTLVAVGLLLPHGVMGQGQAIDVSWAPRAPAQGEFAYVVLVPRYDIRAVRGALDRTPLYFELDGDRYVALAAVRLSAPDSVTLALWLEDASGEVTTVERALPVRRGRFTTERLTVDPRFSNRLDSALAARVRDETRRAGLVARRALETPRLWDEPFLAPLIGRVTSPYGKGRIFNGELKSRHWGTDFDGDVGDPVRVANRGVVELVDEFYYGGNVVYVNHGAGLVTVYMHLSAALVARGDTVQRGQVVARVGQTGRVTGPHLHWSVRFGRATVNGLSLLALPWSVRVGTAASP